MGARGFCAESLLSCLRCLGFPNKLCRSVLREMSNMSLRCSFDIWMARNTSIWNFEARVPCVLDTIKQPPSSNKAPSHAKAFSSYANYVTPTSFKAAVPPPKPVKQKRSTLSHIICKPKVNHSHCGLLNKGNTCYVNVVLQTLKPLTSIWSNPSNNIKNLSSPLVSAFHLIMPKLENTKSCLDPSAFLSSLQNSIRNTGKPAFNINSQQDVVEVLEHILNELLVESDTVMVKHDVETSCNSCHNSFSREDLCLMLQLPIKCNIQQCLNFFLRSELMENDNALFCRFCESKESGETQIFLKGIGTYLIIQLKRFNFSNGATYKNSFPVVCSPYLNVPVRVDNEVTCIRNFALISGICHSGKLDSGHYTAFV